MGHLPRILLVDDDASGRAMLGLSLRQAGFSVSTAADGEEALDLLGQRNYDWLITDAKMDPMDGFELSNRARLLRPHLRIAMISAVCEEGDIAGYPIERLFSKPVPLESLTQFLHGAPRHS